MIKIQPGVEVSTDDFWYDLVDGGYLKPEEICAFPADARRVKDAIIVLQDFQRSCEQQITGFFNQ